MKFALRQMELLRSEIAALFRDGRRESKCALQGVLCVHMCRFAPSLKCAAEQVCICAGSDLFVSAYVQLL